MGGLGGGKGGVSEQKDIEMYLGTSVDGRMLGWLCVCVCVCIVVVVVVVVVVHGGGGAVGGDVLVVAAVSFVLKRDVELNPRFHNIDRQPPGCALASFTSLDTDLSSLSLLGRDVCVCT